MKCVAFLLACCLSASAIDDNLAVKALVGEDANGTYQEMVAIAGAIRNRGTLHGVIGLRNMHMINAQPASVYEMARSAWAESATNDLSCGGSFFDSTNFPPPRWSVNMKVTARVGRFVFYKP